MKEIYFSEIKFLPNLPCYTPLSNYSCQQLWQNYLDTLTDKVCFQTAAPRYTCTTQQFVQANTRMLVKGQAFPWKEGSSQTAMPKVLDTLLVCLCVGYWVCLGVCLQERECMFVCTCESTHASQAHEHVGVCITIGVCWPMPALLWTAGLVSLGTGSACCDWMTSSLCCVKACLAVMTSVWDTNTLNPLCTTVHFISQTVLLLFWTNLITLTVNALTDSLFNLITQLYAEYLLITQNWNYNWYEDKRGK